MSHGGINDDGDDSSPFNEGEGDDDVDAVCTDVSYDSDDETDSNSVCDDVTTQRYRQTTLDGVLREAINFFVSATKGAVPSGRNAKDELMIVYVVMKAAWSPRQVVILLPWFSVSNKADDAVASPDLPGLCDVCCFDDVLPLLRSGDACEHRFCANCHFRALTSSRSAAATSWPRCWASGCDAPLSDRLIRRVSALCGEQNAAPTSLYNRLLLETLVSLVETTRWMVKCPNSLLDCHGVVIDDAQRENDIKSDDGASLVGNSDSCLQEMTCSSCQGASICLRCLKQQHLPATCDEVERWRMKFIDFSATHEWLTVNAKTCPKCQVPIEKNQGCSHMTCSHCRYEFCWTCLSMWKDHESYYSCNKFKATASSGDQLNVASTSSPAVDGVSGPAETTRKRLEAEAAFAKFTFCRERYEEHQRSILSGARYLTQLIQRLSNDRIENNQGTWIDWQYLPSVKNEIISTREILKFSYIHRYYFPGGDGHDGQCEIFEDIQGKLEKAVEQVSYLLTEASLEARAQICRLRDRLKADKTKLKSFRRVDH